jgi:hypothetical protein
MRDILRLGAFSLILLAAQAQAQTGRPACPADAERAGYSIWGPGSLKPGQVKRARHACGREIECIGARSSDTNRACRWI